MPLFNPNLYAFIFHKKAATLSQTEHHLAQSAATARKEQQLPRSCILSLAPSILSPQGLVKQGPFSWR